VPDRGAGAAAVDARDERADVIAAARRHAQAADVDEQVLATQPDLRGNARLRQRRSRGYEPFRDRLNAGGRIHPLHGHSYHLGWNRKDAPRYNHVRECDFITGCGFLLRSDVMKKINFFNSDLVFYSEDADLCYRVREQGYKVMYIPGAKMWHKVSTTLAKNRPLQLRYSTRNGLYLLQRHRVGVYPLSLLVNLFVVCPIKMALFCAALRWKNSIGIYQGIRDWRSGTYGWVRAS